MNLLNKIESFGTESLRQWLNDTYSLSFNVDGDREQYLQQILEAIESSPECKKLISWIENTIKTEGLVGMGSHNFVKHTRKFNGKEGVVEPNSTPTIYILYNCVLHGINPEQFALEMNGINQAIAEGRVESFDFNDSYRLEAQTAAYKRAMTVVDNIE